MYMICVCARLQTILWLIIKYFICLEICVIWLTEREHEWKWKSKQSENDTNDKDSETRSKNERMNGKGRRERMCVWKRKRAATEYVVCFSCMKNTWIKAKRRCKVGFGVAAYISTLFAYYNGCVNVNVISTPNCIVHTRQQHQQQQQYQTHNTWIIQTQFYLSARVCAFFREYIYMFCIFSLLFANFFLFLICEHQLYQTYVVFFLPVLCYNKEREKKAMQII